MKNKSRAVLIVNDNIIIIKRKKDNTVYYVFPGGSVEAGEINEDACARELKEELGITVSVDSLLFELNNHVDNLRETFYKCTLLSGIVGSGDDKKFTKGTKESENYSIVSMNIDEISKINLLPLTVRDMIVNMYK